jgi:hypothetical protein
MKPHAIPTFWKQYFFEGCREAGIECLEVPGVDWAAGLDYSSEPLLTEWRSRSWEKTISFARAEHAHKSIDFFLCYLFPKQVDVAAVKCLQEIGIPAVNFFCDNLRQFRRVPIEYRSFALHWVPEFEALQMYCDASLPHIHAPMPCWVSPALRRAPIAENHPPSFIGSADILRGDLFGRAIQVGAKFIVYGRGWAKKSNQLGEKGSLRRTFFNQLSFVQQHGLNALVYKVEDRLYPLRSPPIPKDNIGGEIVTQDEYVRLTREAVVTLGVNRVPTEKTSNRSPLVYSRLRDIEAPMLGACYLTEWTAGLEQLYELGTEIETYKTPEELHEKLNQLVQDKTRRVSMRKLGQRRSLEEHCIPRTMKRICDRLGVSTDE